MDCRPLTRRCSRKRCKPNRRRSLNCTVKLALCRKASVFDHQRIDTINSYVKDVFRFGGDQPYRDEDGNRFNLKHDTAFDAHEVTTDGNGNIVSMPLLLDKPCFARPERYIRGSHDEATPPFTGRNSTDRWRLSRCQRCPVEEGCAKVVLERIESSIAISTAFADWDDQASDKPFERRAGKLWRAFLRAIVQHGGWKSTNDEAVADALLSKALDNKAKRKADRQRLAAEARSKRQGQSRTITAEFLDEVEAERRRRADILLGLRTKPLALKHLPTISRLSPAGCERTADVWAASAIIERSEPPITGNKIAQYLIDHCGYSIKLESLTTWVYKDLERIRRLEGDIAGTTFWSRFTPRH